MKNITSKKLKNGMKLIFAPQEGAQSMTLLALSKVGSRYESPALNGAAHFVEHLMFKGTEKRPSTLDISKELDRYGSEYNAYTGKDITGYYIKMDAAHTNIAIDMLHDMLFHSKFDPAEVERERTVILEEINMYEDNPRDHIADMVEDALFYGSSLGRNIAGTRKTVKAMSRNALRGFYEQFYIPERMTVVLAGKINAEAATMFQKTFGSVKSPKIRSDRPFTCFKAPRKLAKPLAYEQKQTEQVQLSFGFYGIPYGHPDRHAATLLGLILGGSMSSRLFIEIRERLGLCYAVRAAHESLEDTGILTISAGLDKTRLSQAVKAIYKELNKIVQEPVSKDELQRAKDHTRGSLALAFEDTAMRAKWFGWEWVYEQTLETPKDRLVKIDAVTVQDIRRVARTILNPRCMVSAAIGPLGSANAFKKIIQSK